MVTPESETRLEWVILGIKDVERMTAALNNMAKSQESLNRALGKKVTVTNTTKQFDKYGNTLTRVAKVGKDGNLAISQTLDSTRKKTEAATRATNSLALSWKSVNRIIVGSLISRGISAFTVAIREALTEATDFQKRISEIRTISQNNQQSFQAWTENVRRLSDEFNRAPTDVAEGFYQALSNQMAEGAETAGFMTEALRLARITNSSTEDSVKALTGSLNAFDLSAGNARFAADNLFKTVELGRTRLNELANSLGSVQILAKQLGVSFQEVNASIDVLSIQGISAVKSQTLLRAIFLKLIKPTDALRKVFEDLGTNTGANTIATFGLAGTLEKLEEAAEKSGDRLDGLGKLLGRVRAITGAAGTDVEELRDALLEMRGAATASANSLDIIRESAGEKLSAELNKISNFFVVDLGIAAQKNLVAVTESFGGLANSVKFVTTSVIELTKAITIGLAVSGGVAVARLLTSFGSLRALIIEVRLQAAIFATSFTGLAVIAGAVGFAGVKAFSSIRDKLIESKQLVTDFSGALTQDLVSAFREADAEQLRLNADTERVQLNTISKVKRFFLQSIAEQTAAINKLKGLEADRATLADKIFNIRFKRAGLLGKENILFKSVVNLRKQAQKIAAADVLDAEALNDVLSEAASKEALISKLKDKRGFVSSRFVRQELKLIDKIALSVDNRLKKESIAGKSQIATLDEQNKQVRRNLVGLEKAGENIPEQFKKSEENALLLNNQLDTTLQLVSRISQQLKGKLLPEIGPGPTKRQTVVPIPENIEANKNLQAIITASNSVFEAIEKVRSGGVLTEKVFQDILTNIAEVQKGLQSNLQNVGLTDTQIVALQHQADVLRSARQFLTESFTAQANIQGELGRSRNVVDTYATFITETTGATIGFFNETTEASNRIVAEAILKYGQATGAYRSMATEANSAASAVERLNRAQAGNIGGTNRFFGGNISRFADGGSVGGDTVNAKLTPGEFVMDKTHAREFFPQLVAMSSGAARFNDGGSVTNNNIGDINVSVNGGDTSEATVRDIGNKLRREISRGTLRLN